MDSHSLKGIEMVAMYPHTDQPQRDILAEAGVFVGGRAIWRWNMPIVGDSGPRVVTVVGTHKNGAGVLAIEVRDERGQKFRAYPDELTNAAGGTSAERGNA